MNKSELTPEYSIFGNKGAVWSKECHISKNSNSTTLCGLPMLSSNWARIENVEEIGCAKCLVIYAAQQESKLSIAYDNLPQNSFFVITQEYLSPGSEFTDATPEQIAAINQNGFTVHFKMYDDDDILYYGGYLKTELDGTEDAFSPLDDYGAPNAGCTDIKYLEKDGEYHSL